MADEVKEKMVEVEPAPENNSEAVPPKKEIKKVEKKIVAAEKKIEKITGERQNIIGEEGLVDSDDPKEWRAALKQVDEKLDKLIAQLETKKSEDTSLNLPPTTIEVPWYDRELL